MPVWIWLAFAVLAIWYLGACIMRVSQSLRALLREVREIDRRRNI